MTQINNVWGDLTDILAIKKNWLLVTNTVATRFVCWHMLLCRPLVVRWFTSLHYPNAQVTHRMENDCIQTRCWYLLIRDSAHRGVLRMGNNHGWGFCGGTVQCFWVEHYGLFIRYFDPEKFIFKVKQINNVWGEVTNISAKNTHWYGRQLIFIILHNFVWILSRWTEIFMGRLETFVWVLLCLAHFIPLHFVWQRV